MKRRLASFLAQKNNSGAIRTKFLSLEPAAANDNLGTGHRSQVQAGR